jgi:hypothetical protein
MGDKLFRDDWKDKIVSLKDECGRHDYSEIELICAEKQVINFVGDRKNNVPVSEL